jgi:hypothetical protein
MTWHHPDLYFFLGLLAVFAGLAASLAVIYECILKFRRRKPLVVLPLDGLQRDRHARPIEQRASKRPSDFSQLCESINNAAAEGAGKPRACTFRNRRRSAAQAGFSRGHQPVDHARRKGAKKRRETLAAHR